VLVGIEAGFGAESYLAARESIDPSPGRWSTASVDLELPRYQAIGPVIAQVITSVIASVIAAQTTHAAASRSCSCA